MSGGCLIQVNLLLRQGLGSQTLLFKTGVCLIEMTIDVSLTVHETKRGGNTKPYTFKMKRFIAGQTNKDSCHKIAIR